MQKKVLIAGQMAKLDLLLAKKLLERGFHVLYIQKTIEKEEIKPLVEYPGFSFQNHDLCHSIFLKIDEIYDLSSFSVQEEETLEEFTKRAFFGFHHLLSLAKRSKAKILHLAKLEEESFSPYFQGKKVIEALCSEKQKEKKKAKIFWVPKQISETLQSPKVHEELIDSMCFFMESVEEGEKSSKVYTTSPFCSAIS